MEHRHSGHFPPAPPQENPSDSKEEILLQFETFKTAVAAEVNAFEKNVDTTLTVFMNTMEDKLDAFMKEIRNKIK